MYKRRGLSRGTRLYAAIAFLVLLTLHAPGALAELANGKLQIHHIDVGQGDGALIVSPLGQLALVDNGVYNNCSLFLNYINSLSITSIDYHFASHYHADHIGCLDDLIAGGVPLNIAGYDRGYSYTTQTYQTYVAALGSKRQTMLKNQVITLDAGSDNPVYIKCVDLNGAGVYSGTDENSKSMVLKITYGEFDEVLGGDLTNGSAPVETTVGPEVGDVEVYKVHHHSSATSSYDSWLNATTPEVAVISVGTNSYGYVNATTLTRIHNHGVKTYWTEAGSAADPVAGWDKVGGTIIIEADPGPGAAYTVKGSGFVDTYYNSGSMAGADPVPTAVGFGLVQNYPNPFNPVTNIEFSLDEDDKISLKIYDISGRVIRTLVEGTRTAGTHTVLWDGRDNRGEPLVSGVYVYRLEAPGKVAMKKMVLLK
jgi:beta-lactamase superfamily II metal-dependent hydrolase